MSGAEAAQERVRYALLAGLVGDDVPELGKQDRERMLSMLGHDHRLWWDELVQNPAGTAVAAFRVPNLDEADLQDLVRHARKRVHLSVLLQAILSVPGRDRAAADVLFLEIQRCEVYNRPRVIQAALAGGGPRTRATALALTYLAKRGHGASAKAAAVLASEADETLEIFVGLARDDLAGGGSGTEDGLETFTRLLDSARILASEEGSVPIGDLPAQLTTTTYERSDTAGE